MQRGAEQSRQSTTQAFACGTGSIDVARGTAVGSDHGVDVRGEQDIFGTPWRPATLTRNALNETAWVAASWNGMDGRRLDLRHLVGTQLARCRAAGVSHPLTT